MAPLQPVCPSTELGWKDLVLGGAHAHEAERDLLCMDVLMKWDNVSGKSSIRTIPASVNIDPTKSTLCTPQKG